MFEIGNTLREARLRRGLDIAECEAGTKIRAKYLRAMEDEDFDQLPSPAYVRGFLRTYAHFLGLDGRLMSDEYESRGAGPDHGDHDARRPRAGAAPARRGARVPAGGGGGRRAGRPARRRTEAQLLWLAIGGVMAVALLVWMGVGNPSPPSPPMVPATTGAPTAAAELEPPSELDTPEAPEALAITLTGRGAFGSYVEVRGRDARGPQVFAGTLGEGERRTFRVQRSLWVRTYNAEGLSVTIKDKTRALSGGTGDFLVTRAGVRPVAGGADGPG